MSLARKATGLRSVLPIAAAAVLLAGLGVLAHLPASAEDAVRVPPPMLDTPSAAPLATETAVLAGGCFWGVQGVFQHVEGVTRVLSGYSGGTPESATYPAVSSGATGHAESVQITFDPTRISYGEILQIFFSVAHDPTQVNRQGPDYGPQYRSALFYADARQQAIAQAYIAQLDAAQIFDAPIATRVDPLEGFTAAEDYHQDYLVRNPDSRYIQAVDLPKLDHLEALFPEIYRKDPVLALPDGSSS